jgi:hypothetical protein
MVDIYCLKDPDTGEVFYVGQTNMPFQYRLNGHIKDAERSNSKKSVWIDGLIAQNKLPIIDAVEQCSDEESNTREKYWIQHYREANPSLTNANGAGSGNHKRPRFSVFADDDQ